MDIITLICILFFVLFVNFIFLRPQRKKDERFSLMVASVKPGSVVYAAGGIHGTVLEVGERSFLMVTAPAKTRLEVDSDAIEQVEGFDYKAEKARQKAVRQSRTMGKGRK